MRTDVNLAQQRLAIEDIVGKFLSQVGRISKYYASSAVSFILIGTGVATVPLALWLRFSSPHTFASPEFLGLLGFGMIALVLGSIERLVVLRLSPGYLTSVTEALMLAAETDRTGTAPTPVQEEARQGAAEKATGNPKA
jgi:hypothetical protein